MSPSRTDASRRAVRWLLPAAALALLPKCLACAAAYFGLGAALGLAGPELCGVSGTTAVTWALATIVAGVLVSFVFVRRRRRRRACPAQASR